MNVSRKKALDLARLGGVLLCVGVVPPVTLWTAVEPRWTLLLFLPLAPVGCVLAIKGLRQYLREL